MARAAPEQINAERVDVPFEVPVAHVAAGSKVFIEYSRSQTGRAPFAADGEIELTVSGGKYTGSQEFDPGIQIRFRARVEEPGQPSRYVIRDVTKGYDLKNAVAGPEPSPSPTTPTTEVNTRVKAQVKAILDSLKTHEGAQGADALVDNLINEIDAMGVTTGDHRHLILKNVADAIAEMESVPHAVRAQFKGRPAPGSFPELEQRLKRGGELFRAKVFNSLKADPKTREALHIKPGSKITDLHGEEAAAFTKVCSEFFPGSEDTAYLGVAFENASRVPATNPALSARRQTLLRSVVSRLAPHEKSDFLSKIPAGRKAKMLDVVVQLGSAGLLLTGTAPIAGAVGLIGKGALETLSGISTQDIIRSFDGGGHGHGHGHSLWEIFKQNNIVSRMLTTDQTSGSVLKSRFGDWMKRWIPGSAFWYGGKTIGEGDEHGGHDDHGGEHGEGEHHDIDELIRTACQKEVGTGGGH